jgi:hypothetical protein
MGFLSKLFGGDAGAPPSKSAGGSSSSSTELESSVAVRAPVKADDAAPGSAAAPAPASAAVSGGAEPAAPKAPPRGPVAADAKALTSAAGAPASSVEPSREVARRAPPARPASPAKQIKSAADAALASLDAPASSSATIPDAPAAAPPPDSPRKAPARVAESSIITSAPALGEPQRSALAPRPVAAKAPKAAATADPNAPRERAPMSSLSGESGLLASSRTRKDRSKSPGFYSNVSSSASQSHLKRTVVGVAPPPDLGGFAAPDGGAGADAEKQAADAPLNGDEAAARVAPGATDNAMPAAETALANTQTVDRPKHEVVRAPVSAAPTAPAEGEEKEETSPGLGFTPSRHDPALRTDLPERDIELLVDFVMDLGLGLASEAWLGAAREAVARLAASAALRQRNALEKALHQLSVELDAPNALAEERRARILQQLVLVDLAMPRPVDVPGRRLVRERLIVQHLIGELAGSFPRVAQFLREDGVASLERLGRLRPEELAGRADVSVGQAEQALATFKDYLAERARRGPSLALLGKGHVLEQLLRELSTVADEFERSQDDDDPSSRREARKKRQAAITRLSLFLAECGEAGVLGEIERSSVQGKIARLERWLNELPPSSARASERELPRQGTTG